MLFIACLSAQICSFCYLHSDHKAQGLSIELFAFSSILNSSCCSPISELHLSKLFACIMDIQFLQKNLWAKLISDVNDSHVGKKKRKKSLILNVYWYGSKQVGWRRAVHGYMGACTQRFNMNLQHHFCMSLPQLCKVRGVHMGLLKQICHSLLQGKVTVQLTAFIAISYLWKGKITYTAINVKADPQAWVTKTNSLDGAPSTEGKLSAELLSDEIGRTQNHTMAAQGSASSPLTSIKICTAAAKIPKSAHCKVFSTNVLFKNMQHKKPWMCSE